MMNPSAVSSLRTTWRISALLVLFSLLPTSNAVTVYYQAGTQAAMAAAASPTGNYTGPAAYSPVTLAAPAPPGPTAFPTQFSLQLTNAVPQNASVAQNGSFFGFSIEMSVVNQVIGFNSTVLYVPFLNLMANIQQRVGRVNIRVGGNTQETATLVDSTPDGKILEKDKAGATNPTQTPPLIFTPDLLYMLRNVSDLVNVRWYLGVPFNDTSNFRLEIIEQGQQILGDYLIGLQAGNEPDLYANHGHRNQSYAPGDYFNDFGLLINAMSQDSSISPRSRDLLLGPSIQVLWTPEQIWNTGFVTAYSQELAFLSVERYPTDNCAVAFPGSDSTFHDPQQTFPTFLTHQSATGLVSEYLNSTAFALQNGKSLLMFETNTASCGGFPGISNSFGAALWGVDYALQMAAVNFGGALFHVGGQSVSYNPFTPPPTNESTFHQWTVGPIYYSALVVAEALGPSNTSQVLDLQANGANQFSPAYGIWEKGALARVVLINFVDDPSGQSDVFVSLGMSDASMPSQVDVKYLLSPSVSDIANFTWAGQTFGDNFASDGRPVGTVNVTTLPCTNGVCTIHVPAPGAAIVFLNSNANGGNNQNDGVTAAPATTFSTTTYTRTRNTITIDPAVLATSNGHSGSTYEQLGSTSADANKNGAVERRSVLLGAGLTAAVALVAGWLVL
ncbi:glycoside hydrolase family 79 protein [Gymnopilus junonius]|uniref:Glycoside hydrolase family 79 protein n=1 Tax=Gymnopilus junonius TaxID=109634 RepID=A0A9P5NKC2_GYMJU|nr:glycoside hydrolase family 79 protein [Gymnopilus junonius]